MSPPRPALALVRRSVAISPTGSFVAMRAANANEIVDAVGTAPHDALSEEVVVGALWRPRDAASDRRALDVKDLS